MNISKFDIKQALPKDVQLILTELEQNSPEVLSVAFLVPARMHVQAKAKVKPYECDSETCKALDSVAEQITRQLIAGTKDIFHELAAGANCSL